MRWWMVAAYGLSVVAHIGLAAGIGSIPKNRPRKVSVVKVFDAKPAKKKAAEEEKKPPKVETKPKPPPPPKNTPPPPTNAAPPPPQAPMAALPDFGLSLSGGGDSGGIAIPVAGMMAAATANHAAGSSAGGGAEKRVRAAAPKPSEASDGCVEAPTKPKPTSRSQPQYVDEARSANVEGVVKFEIRVGPDGEVLDVRILQGLGHGLDQSVLAAVKSWKFAPSTRCGKPVESRYVSQIRFGLTGD